MLKVLVACEYSGRVRDAFTKNGHFAMSCDLLPSDAPGLHYQGDVFDIVDVVEWDLMICHPPCTHLAVSGARHFAAKQTSGVQQEALDFVQRLLNLTRSFNLGSLVMVKQRPLVYGLKIYPTLHRRVLLMGVKLGFTGCHRHLTGGNFAALHTKGSLMRWQINGVVNENSRPTP